MSDKVTLATVNSFKNDTTAVNQINSNSISIQTAFDNTLSLNGIQPNSMNANLDMNSNHILNLPSPISPLEPLRVMDATTLTTGSITLQPVPVGGLLGQYLAKHSNANYDVKWNGLPFLNVLDFGADPTGAVDSTAAIQNCINAAEPVGQNVVVPPGSYVTNSGVTLNNCIMYGTGSPHAGFSQIISGTGHDIATVTITGNGGVVNLQIVGPNFVGCTQPALNLTNTAVENIVYDCRLVFGYNAIKCLAADFLILDIHAELAYGNAILYLGPNGGGYCLRNKLDQNFPAIVVPNSITPRANSTGYSVGQVVTTGGWYLQCVTAGTSGIGAPTLTGVAYFGNISDGTVKWNLTSPIGGCSLMCDGTFEVFFWGGDCSNCHDYGIVFADSTNTGGPQGAFIQETDFNNITNNIFVSTPHAAGIVISQSQLGALIVNGATAVLSQGRDWSFEGNHFIGNGTGFGLNVEAGTGIRVENNMIVGFSTGTGILMNAGVSNFNIAGNQFASDEWGANTNAITVATGGSDYYIIQGNLVHGQPVTDGGTGTHKFIGNNI